MAKRGRIPQRARRTYTSFPRGATVVIIVAIVAGISVWLIGQGARGNTSEVASFPPTQTPQPTRTPLATPYLGMPTVGQVLPSPTPQPPQTPLPQAVAQTQQFPVTGGGSLALRSFRGNKIVLYFYEAAT